MGFYGLSSNGFTLRIRKVNPKVKVAVDNTFLTSWVCKPLEFGVDIVMHSVTKYINGHSDVIMGALLTNDTLLHDQLYKIQKYRGATPSAFDCFLVLRSLATLELRFQYLHSFITNHYMTDLFKECSNTWRVVLKWPHFCHHILLLPMSFILSCLIILNIKLL